MKLFKEIIVSVRIEQGLTLSQLSILSGISRSTIFNYERGVSPTLEKANLLLAALGVTLTIGKNADDPMGL